MSRIAFSLLLTAIFLLFPIKGEVQAQTSYNPYEVRNVAVDVTDTSSVKARDRAFIEAQNKAFAQLSSRMGYGDRPSPSQDMIASMVQDFEIEKEQLSTKRYLGSFTIRFRPSAINGYFGQNVARSPEAASENEGVKSSKLLILPFTVDASGPFLWNKERNYLWQALMKNPTLPATGMILPQGNISDQTDVWEKNPNLLSMSSIRKIRERYGMDEVVVVDIRSGGKANPDTSFLDMYRTDLGRVELVKTIPVSNAFASTEGTIYTKGAQMIVDALGGQWKPVNYQNRNVQQQNDAVTVDRQQDTKIEDPVAATGNTPPPYQQTYQNPSVPHTIPSFSMTGATRIRAVYNSIPEWSMLQSFLKNSSSVDQYKIVSVKVHEAELDVLYKDWAFFQSELLAKGYKIQPLGNGSYRIYR
ncbi:MAG: hypothetical protein AUJ12_09850 [Alphaproteobacteria bacterium CG1_02_46_17]|nr:MAG: hypothetical protein AUJ12_09850 [Alphaproteobacteria bacterium CG1_02_46_17]